MSAPYSDYASAAQACYHGYFGRQAQVEQEIRGFYGCAVLLRGDAGDAVVKFGYQAGRAAREVAGLARLRAHSRVALPLVLQQTAVQVAGQQLEVLLLNRLPGVAPWHVAQPWRNAEQTALQVVDALRAWHDISDTRGFELPDGQFSADLLVAFDAWTTPLHDYVQSAASPFTAPQREAFALLWAERKRLLATIRFDTSSMVHDDPHAGNFLFDETTGDLLAALDPCDAAFRHYEQDIFHLADAAPELQLLETYTQHYPPAEGFAARRWFFSLWDDAKHSRNMGWYDEPWFNEKLAKLASVDKAFSSVGGMISEASHA